MTSFPPVPVLAAPSPARGGFAPGYERVAHVFAEQIRRGEEIGAGLTIYRGDTCVVDLWGGWADREAEKPWERDTRLVLFSVTKGLAAMALHLLVDRGLLEWDAPVTRWWPEFGRAGKKSMTVRTLVNHQGGLAALDRRLTLNDCIDPSKRTKVLAAIEKQKPLWEPGTDQAYHALTFGLYVAELFRRAAGEEMGPWLRRELLDPIGSDVWLGAPASLDERTARLYPPTASGRVARMIYAGLRTTGTTEGRVVRTILRPKSLARAAFSNPSSPGGLAAYNEVPVRRACFPSASATGSAHGVARAYAVFAQRGQAFGQRYVDAATLAPLEQRQGWSECDGVLQKPLGWAQGFLKEERHIFSPNTASYGHSGMGGALGWCDPSTGLALGYVMNRMDWRVRSLRCLSLCRALYESEAVLRAERA